MNRLLLSTAVAALVLAAPAAFAADDHHDDKGNQSQPHDDHSSSHTDTGSHDQGPKGGAASGPAMSGPSHTDRTVHTDHTMGGNNGDNSRVKSKSNISNNMHDDGMRGGNNMMMGGNNNNHNNNMMMSGHDNRSHGHVDVSKFKRNVTAQRHYRAGNYHAPRGYHYQRWTFGERLPAIYFSQDYWLSDYGDYGLMEPPYGYVWVRFGPDALLIDQYTGDIVQVVYGQFY